MAAITSPSGVREARPGASRSTPRHVEARQAVESYIRERNLKPGDRLPTEEALRREFGWSRVTITRALNELAWNGTLTRIQGSGTYVADPKKQAPTAAPVPVSEPVRLMVSAQPFSDEDYYCAQLFAGIRAEAVTRGVDIVYFGEERVPSLETVGKIRPHGVLALAWKLDDLPRVVALHEAGIPVVGIAQRSRSLHLPLVCTDNFGGVQQAVRHLLQAGHRHIACETINIQNSDVFERLSAFQFEMAQAGLAVDPSYLQVSHWPRKVPLLEAWWRSLTPKPTALLMDGTNAPALLAALQKQNVRIPDDLSVICIDEREALRYYTPRLTTLRQPTFALGRRGLGKLVELLDGMDDGGPEVLPTELIPGDSVQTLSDPSSDERTPQ